MNIFNSRAEPGVFLLSYYYFVFQSEKYRDKRGLKELQMPKQKSLLYVGLIVVFGLNLVQQAASVHRLLFIDLHSYGSFWVGPNEIQIVVYVFSIVLYSIAESVLFVSQREKECDREMQWHCVHLGIIVTSNKILRLDPFWNQIQNMPFTIKSRSRCIYALSLSERLTMTFY